MISKKRKRRRLLIIGIGVNVVALVCWGIMFLAGTDLWHAAGSPEVWTLGIPNTDWQVFVYAFYALFLMLVLNLITQFASSTKV